MRRPFKINSKKISWNGKVATVEASNVGITVESLSIYGWPRIIEVTSHRTWRTLHFIPSRQILDQGGEDVVAIEYISPGSGVKPLHILND